jgi:hypothetical protein
MLLSTEGKQGDTQEPRCDAENWFPCAFKSRLQLLSLILLASAKNHTPVELSA